MRSKLGECLVQAGLIAEDDLRRALEERKRTGERLGIVLVRLKLTTEEQIARALARQLGFRYISLVDNPPNPSAVVLIPKGVAAKRACIAVRVEKHVLTLAMSDPLLFSLVQDLEFQTGYRIEQVVAARSEIVDAIGTAYPDEAPASRREFAPTVPSTTASGEAASSTDVVDRILSAAIKSKASDIHVEPTENAVLVRHRVDGTLEPVMELPMRMHDELVGRLKTMAGMDVAETRLPQEGRLRVASEDGDEIAFRVSTLRTVWGEKVVVRLVEGLKEVPSLEELGLTAIALDAFRHCLRSRQGMIFVVGPVASGRSATLAAALRSVQSANTNVVTVEDRVEYRIPGVNQTQIDDNLKLTFASALRSILSQDPDVIVVGEVRDAETATIVAEAAQTGRLVLSTLRTADAPSVVTRLIDLGVEPRAIAGALVGAVAQRLVRRLCTQCHRPYTPPPDVARDLGLSDADGATFTCYQAIGCDQCNHTGYRGRVGIYEVMRVTDRLRRVIAADGAEDQIREAASQGGMVSLAEDGLAKVRNGTTTPEELLRVVSDVGDARALCPACGTAIGGDFRACPHCGTRIGGGCPHCGRALQPGWNYCPYCARSTEPRKAPKRPRVREARHDRPGTNIAEFKK